MSKITALKNNKRTNQQVNMFLDGKFAISLDTELAVKEGLKIGQELSAEQIETLVKNLGLTRCLNAAYRYLSYRPRSEAEMRERLHRREFENPQIEIVINKLKEQNLLDDTAFAQFWQENRETFRPRSKRLTRLELKKKGVADTIINEVTSQVDDTDSAYSAALGKAQRLPHQDYEVFRRRLGDYLKRRGFDYTVINQTVKRIWQELVEPG
ncbi:MAG: RecX family transcriptional regulator [Dehalococcoidales bacterium]|nr:RecX family transcriptional regulator [Dehalococcoidales bacterium]